MLNPRINTWIRSNHEGLIKTKRKGQVKGFEEALIWTIRHWIEVQAKKDELERKG
jgi:hypothetical protein